MHGRYLYVDVLEARHALCLAIHRSGQRVRIARYWRRSASRNHRSGYTYSPAMDSGAGL